MKLYQVYVSLIRNHHFVEGKIYAKNEQIAINKAKKALRSVTKFDDTMIATAYAEEIKEDLKAF